MYKKILVPLDGSPLAECALEAATTIAKGLDINEVTLFTAVEPTSSPILRGGYSPDDRIRAQKQAESTMRDYLTQVAERLDGVKSNPVVVYGFAAEEILKYSKEAGIDLIIMSTHGRSGVSKWLTGSVATKVINHSTIPVLIVPPSGCRA